MTYINNAKCLKIMNVRHFLLTLVLALTAIVLKAQNAPDGYYFTNYKVQMTVHEDNTYSIVEDIDAFFTEERHGLLRYIPVHPYVKRDVSEKQDGSLYEVKGYYVDVEDVQVSEQYSTDTEDSNLYGLRIGSADATITGPHHYTISYTLVLPWDRIPQADLFFHSVLGSGWNCDVQNFSFSVKFDKPLPKASIDALAVFSGDEGSDHNQREAIITSLSDTSITGAVSNLSPYQAVTLHMPLPEAYFSYTLWQDKAAWAFVLLSIILLVVTLYKEMMLSSKVIKVMTVVPPKGLSSAEVGTIFDCSVDDCDIISLIPWFASQGYISIDNTGEYPVLTKLKDLPKSAPAYQKTFFDGMFPGDSKTFDTGKDTDRSFGKAWYATKAKLTRNFENKLDEIDGTTFVLYILALLAVSFAVCFATCLDGWLMGGITTVCFGAMAFVMLYFGSTAKKLVHAICAGMACALCVAIVATAFSEQHTVSGYYIPYEVVYSLLVGIGIVSFFAYRMMIMTPYRRELMGEILGLEEFIRLSEEPQLRQLQADEERYFYDVLPFAVALGMSEIWAKKFENITIQPNENYVVNNASQGLLAYNLSRGVMSPAFSSGISAETKAREAAARAASSSGSSRGSSSSYSGGGFSGGGFGGGGGGSW